MQPEPRPASPTPSPWRTIWLSPRQTIRGVVSANVRPSLVPVVGIAFIAVLLNAANTALSSPPLWRSLLRGGAIAFCVMTGYIAFGPVLLAWHGRWRNGVGGRREIRQALAWGYAPIAASVICWLPLWIATNGSAYDYDIRLPPILRLLTLPPFLAANLLGPIWSFGLTVVMLAEVQRFSVWRAIDGIVMLWVLGLICFLVIGLAWTTVIT